MKHTRTKIAWIFAAVVMAIGISRAPAADQYTSQTTTRSEYVAGSDEGLQIQEWLRAKDAPFGPGHTLKFAPSDRISVELRSTSVASGVATQSVRSPPVPLPTSGQPGDTITVTHTSGSWTQSWSYQWSGNSIAGAWGLIAYRIEKVRVGPMPD